MHEYQRLQPPVYQDVQVHVHGSVNHYLHTFTCTCKSLAIIVIMGFLGLPITMLWVFSAYPKPRLGFYWLTLNHAYRNPCSLHSHMWFLIYHKPTLQSGFWLTTNLHFQNGFNITMNFIGVYMTHHAYITHFNSWSYQVHTFQRSLQNIILAY